jgi:hypothetical protein
VADQLRSYPAAKAEVPLLAEVKYDFAKACARVNNRSENSQAVVRSGNTSRSSDIYCALRSIANNSANALPPGIALLSLPKIRPLSEQCRVICAYASSTIQRDRALNMTRSAGKVDEHAHVPWSVDGVLPTLQRSPEKYQSRLRTLGRGRRNGELMKRRAPDRSC